MKLKLWQILVIVALGMGAFCLVCLASSLFIGVYYSLSTSPTVLVENKGIVEITSIPFQKASTELITQVTDIKYGALPTHPTQPSNDDRKARIEPRNKAIKRINTRISLIRNPLISYDE